MAAKAEKDPKTGKWLIQYRYTDWQGNRKKSMKRGFKTKREAEEWLQNFLATKQADFNMLFEDFLKIYYADMETRLREHTMRTKKYVFDLKILPYFGKMKMNEITASDIRKWQSELIKQGYAPTYLKTISNQLAALFNYAVRYYDLPNNPCRKAGSMGKGKADEMNFWTKEEFDKFIDAIMNKQQSYMAFMTLFWTGIRIGELLALNVADVDFEKRTISIMKSYQRMGGRDVITEPKTPKSKRVIAIPQFLAVDLQDYVNSMYGVQGEDRLFPITKYYLEHEMQRGIKESGVKRIRIHDLRHPYVKHTTKIFSLRLMDFQAQAYPDAQRKTRGACQLHRGGQSQSPVRPLCNRKRFSCLPPQAKMSWILYAISMRLSGYTSTRSISSSASSVVSVSASKIALDASMRLSCRACSSCFCFACANTAA